MSDFEEELESIEQDLVELAERSEMDRGKMGKPFSRAKKLLNEGCKASDIDAESLIEEEDFLREYGPRALSSTDLTRGEIRDKENNLKCLDPTASTNLDEGSFSPGTHSKALVYHVDEYPEIVIQSYLELNNIKPSPDGRNSSWGIYNGIFQNTDKYDELKSGARNVLTYRDPESWKA